MSLKSFVAWSCWAIDLSWKKVGFGWRFVASVVDENFVDPCLHDLHCCLCSAQYANVVHSLRYWRADSC